MKSFAITGVAGYIAPRHLKAIKETGNQLVAATDPHDSVGILDSYFENVSFFKEFERFDRFLEKNRRGKNAQRIEYLSICSPNFLHDSYIRLALRIGADAICKKPVVLNPWNLEALRELEKETGRKIYTILQLRLHPVIVELKKKFADLSKSASKKEIHLTYITARGPWYLYSWKGDKEKSGGLSTNIGIHFFDMLMWIFGEVTNTELHYADRYRESGVTELEHAVVRWYLSIDGQDLPFPIQPGKNSTFRSIRIDQEEIEFSDGFGDLHTESYKRILSGNGFSIAEAKNSVELCQKIRVAKAVASPFHLHQNLEKFFERGKSCAIIVFTLPPLLTTEPKLAKERRSGISAMCHPNPKLAKTVPWGRMCLWPTT